MTFELVKAMALNAAREVGRGFTEPDDDWQPIALAMDAKGRGIFMVLDFGPASETKQAFLEEVLPVLLREAGAVAVALVTSSWMLTFKGKRPAVLPRPSESPDREEVLIVSVVDRLRAEAQIAPILRHPDRPPELGPWDVLPEDASFGGLVPETLRRALAPQG